MCSVSTFETTTPFRSPRRVQSPLETRHRMNFLIISCQPLAMINFLSNIPLVEELTARTYRERISLAHEGLGNQWNQRTATVLRPRGVFIVISPFS